MWYFTASEALQDAVTCLVWSTRSFRIFHQSLLVAHSFSAVTFLPFLFTAFHSFCISAGIHNANMLMNFAALYFNSLQMRLIFAKSGYENPWLCSFVLIKQKRRGEREKPWHIVSVIKD